MAKRQVSPREVIYRYVRLLEKKIHVDQVILFGSTSMEKIGVNSDIDLVVLSNDFKKMNFLKRLEFLSCTRGRKCISVAMDIIGYTKEEFSRLSKESMILSEVKRNGQVVWSR